MHLIIYFGGTGDIDNEYSSHGETFNTYNNMAEAIIVAGCKHSQVCGSFAFPDLKGFAKRFTQKLFSTSTDNGLVCRDVTNAKVGILEGSSVSTDSKITGITLCGFSRGAVTCFEVARELNKLAPKVPVDIVANQPVPGNFYQAPGSNATSIADCRDLTNVRNVRSGPHR